MKVAFFHCQTCSHTLQIRIDGGKIEQPARCLGDVCNTINSLTLVRNRCEFADRPVIRLQEAPDSVPEVVSGIVKNRIMSVDGEDDGNFTCNRKLTELN
jgi:DNA replicative helicase MCM subunit Mcm2 (Cdc46/Mcm family)